MKYLSANVRASLLMLIFGTCAMGVNAAQLPEFTNLVKRTSPAVVNISAQRNIADPGPGHYQEEDVPEFFRRFFRDMPREQPRSRPSVGSGMIISEDGYILTNNHVVEGADEIVVALHDRREREATLIGADRLSDLALLKIDADDLPTVELGSSDDLEVGEWVVAIGSPFGFEYSVTAGIVSAKGRSLPENNGNYVPFIQTDVAINPGNSGGPLFDLDGKVVGINSQIFTRSGGFMGLSFAIPVDVAMEVVEQLKEKGSVSRGWLGVLIQRVDRDLAESFGLDRPSGALVTKVYADSPAETGGILEGDIIIEFNGTRIDLSSDLPHVVGRTPANTESEVVIVRGRERKTLSITVGVLDEETIPTDPAVPGQSRDNRLGLVVEELDAEERERRGIKEGVRVVQVGPGVARSAGIRRGDLITMLNGEWVSSPSRFEEIVEDLPAGTAVPVRIVRDGAPLFLAIKITDEE